MLSGAHGRARDEELGQRELGAICMSQERGEAVRSMCSGVRQAMSQSSMVGTIGMQIPGGERRDGFRPVMGKREDSP